jgi:hypothetical protein
MNKILFIFLFSMMFLQGRAQILPAYTATVYDTTFTGYYFVCPITGPNQSVHMILDTKGDVVYYRRFLNTQSYDFKLHPNGMISYYALTKFYLLDSTFTVRDSIVPANGYQINIHDLDVMNNGHFLFLANESVTMDLSSYNYFLHNGSPGSSNATVRSQIIQEFDENHNLVHEWHLKDIFSFDSVDPYWLFSPNVVDWTHSNSIDAASDGHYLISSRHFNEITKINSNTGAIMWRLGGNHNQFTFLNDTIPFYGQHDARQVSNGNITLFDNGNYAVPHGARALEYHLDTMAMTADLVWSYVFDSAMHSNNMGNNYCMANDYKIIDYGNTNLNNICFTIVKPDNSKVFELSFNDTLPSYRAFAYEQFPWTLPRPQIICFDSAGTSYLDAGAGHASYLWNNGSTTQVIPVTVADTFSVFVPCGQGFISSEKFIVTNLSNACGLTAIDDDIHADDIYLYPNPAGDILNISLAGNRNYKIQISDMTGRVLYENKRKESSIDISSFDNGLYFISLEGKVKKFIKGK